MSNRLSRHSLLDAELETGRRALGADKSYDTGGLCGGLLVENDYTAKSVARGSRTN